MGPEIIPLTVSLTGDFSDSMNSLAYRYYQDPKIWAIYPKYGKKNGGTLIKVWGENFLNMDNHLRCEIGTKSVPAVFVDEHYVYCHTPPSDVVNSPMPFRVSLNGQQATEEATQYWYYEFPSIYLLDPNRGVDSGGTHVLLKGKL